MQKKRALHILESVDKSLVNDLVTTAKENEAAAINSAGTEAQLDFLLTHCRNFTELLGELEI